MSWGTKMAYDFKEMVRTGTETDTLKTKSRIDAVSARLRPSQARAKTRFQPIEQIMTRFDTMDAGFATA
jgi:hypothetical protein